MVSECIEACPPNGDSSRKSPAPPGFSSFTSFTSGEVKREDATMPCFGSSHPTDKQVGRTNSVDKLRKSVRQRTVVNYNEVDNSCEEHDPNLPDAVAPSTSILKKGVVRGCSKCESCQKVLARWQPNKSRRPILKEVPVFYPSEEEFKDTIKYIEAIRERAEPYGVCRIVPPPSWNPPCPLKEKNVWQNRKFVTRVQRIDKLQNRPTAKKSSCYQNMSLKKRRRLLNGRSEQLDNSGITGETSYSALYSESFGFEPGPYFTLESFHKYADDFKVQYFQSEAECHSEKQRPLEPSVEDIEGEYWRIVENATEEIEVLYGADLETGEFCSGFPKAAETADVEEYVNSGWNLNNLPRLPASVLSFESANISGVLVPWLYVGMCFSSFCWHVEDHHLYSLNYMHWGAPKVWYGVPEKDASKLEDVMKKHLPELFEEQPDLLHKLVTQFSPSVLMLEGIPVYRCVQNAGEFVLTFPRGYHSGFNCGFNCAEAVNVAPFDWLPHGQSAVELYREQCRKITISHDKLLLGAARQAIRDQWQSLFFKKSTSLSVLWKSVCGSEKVLAKSLKARIELERDRRERLCHGSQFRKMDANFDASGDKECFICHYDLYLSASGCCCSPDKFACLNHSEQLCSCDNKMKFFLHRYDISELNILCDALGGKLSSIHRWGISDLGLSLASSVAKIKTQDQLHSNQSHVEDRHTVKSAVPCGNLTNQESSFHIEKHDHNKVATGSCELPCSSVGGQGDHILDVKTDPPAYMPIMPSKEKGLINPVSDEKVSKALDHIPHKLNHENSLASNLQENSSCERKFPFETALKLPANADIELASSFRSYDGTYKSGSQDFFFRDSSGSKTETVQLPDDFMRIRTSDDMVTTCDHQELVVSTPKTSASVMKEGEACLLKNAEGSGLQDPYSHFQGKVRGDVLVENKLSASDLQMKSGILQKSFKSMRDISSTDVVQDAAVSSQMATVNSYVNRCKTKNSLLPEVPTTDGKILPDSVGRRVDKQLTTDSPPCTSSLVEGINLHRGPRIAKVVRRFNCTVEPLQFGIVVPGELWSTSQVIYPKGYKSRVRYFSITDPSQMCYYISEIVDGGSHGPLFMVQAEHCPSEVFIHLSAAKCWEMVRERLNKEIGRQHGLGKFNIPAPQLPGSIDGLEMFGLSSPSVTQAIEALDSDRLCSEYWQSRNTDKIPTMSKNPYPSLGSGAVVIANLFKKADLEELQLLQLALLDDDGLSQRQELMELLDRHLQGYKRATNCK